MRRHVVSSLVVVAVLANIVFAQATTGIPWAGTVRDGLKQALINQKPILLYFYAPDLAACVNLEQHALAHADVQQAIIAHYIPVKINIREVPATAKYYQANDEAQLPCIIILSAEDKVISRFTPKVNPTELVAQLKATANGNPTNSKLEQAAVIAKTASTLLAPTGATVTQANEVQATNSVDKQTSSVTPTAWQPGTSPSHGNALLLPEFAPQHTSPATTPSNPKTSLLPSAVGPLARASSTDVTFGGASPANNGALPAASTVPAAPASAIPSLASYGMPGTTTPASAAAPLGYGMQNLTAVAQPYQQQAQQTLAQYQNTAQQTLANAQVQATQQINTAQQQLATAQQNLQQNVGAAASSFVSAAPAVGSFYDAGLSPRPSATQGANLATVPGLGLPAATAAAVSTPQPSGSPYGMPATTPAASTAAPKPAATTPPATPATNNYALAPGASYGIPNNAPPTPALPGHPKEKAGLANYSTDNLQGYLGNGAKPVLPSAQVNAANAATSQVPPVAMNPAAAVNTPASAATAAAPQIGLQGHCPVTIAEQHKWAKGDPQYGAVHRGKTYLFASAVEQQKFLANPDKYSPVLGGNDPVVMFHEGRYTAGTPSLGAMYKKRMYLFSTPAAKAEFEANPSKYEQAVSMAEAQAGVIVR
jgi:YHS domain-containing protein